MVSGLELQLFDIIESCVHAGQEIQCVQYAVCFRKSDSIFHQTVHSIYSRIPTAGPQQSSLVWVWGSLQVLGEYTCHHIYINLELLLLCWGSRKYDVVAEYANR